VPAVPRQPLLAFFAQKTTAGNERAEQQAFKVDGGT